MVKVWWIYLLFFVATLTGCDSSDMPAVKPEKGVKISLLLSMPTIGSRAVYEDVPFGNDYYIYPSDVEVIIYNADGTFKERVLVPDVQPVDGNYHLYTLMTELENFTSGDLGKRYKIVVLANLKGKTGVVLPTSEQLSVLTEKELYERLNTEYNDSYELTTEVINKGNGGIIPMWGSKTEVIDGDVSLTINLMRAMAKVEVRLSDRLKAEGYEFPYLRSRILQAYGNGWITPANAHLADETELTYVAGTEYSELNVNISDRAYDLFVLHNDNLYAYITEQPANSALATTDLHMEITVQNGTASKTFPMFFAQYDVSGLNPMAFPVRRNHHYIYTITDINSLNYQLSYKVADWSLETIDIPAFE